MRQHRTSAASPAWGRRALLASLAGTAGLGTWQVFFVAHLPGLVGLSSISFAAALWCFHNAIATLTQLTQWAGGGPVSLLRGVLEVIARVYAPHWGLLTTPAFLEATGGILTAAALLLFTRDVRRIWRVYLDHSASVWPLFVPAAISGLSLLLGLAWLVAPPAVFTPVANPAAVGLIVSVSILDLADTLFWIMGHSRAARREPQTP